MSDRSAPAEHANPEPQLPNLGTLEPVPFKVRFLAALGTWVLFYFSTPGIGREGGFGHIAFFALVPWGIYCSRPGPKAFLAEWLAGTIGLSLVFGWLCHVVPGITLPISIRLSGLQ